MGSSRRTKGIVAGLVVVVLAACSSPGTTSPAPTPKVTSFGQADVLRAVDELAKLGVETRVRPSDPAPISAVTGNPSPIRLLRLQVRNLTLEAVAGGGTLGGDLDKLSAAAGGGPVSALLAGWAASGTTAGAKLAASFLRAGAPADPAARAFPSLALLAFIADVEGASGQAASDRALLAVSSSDFCAEVSAYLSSSLNGIVDANSDVPPWLKQLIDLYAPQYKSDPGLLRKTIGALALLTYATSLDRPWAATLTADPATIAYGIVGEDPVGGEVDLTVSAGANVFAADTADCTSLANAQLASIPIQGSSVVWDSSGLGVHATDVAGTAKLDDKGTAALTYNTATESKADADNGPPVTAQMWVNAWVDRAEMAALGAVVKQILLGDAAGTPAGPTVKALYTAMEPILNTVMRPSGFALIDVTYHTPSASPSPTASASAGPSAGASGTGGVCIDTGRAWAEGMPGSSVVSLYPALPNNCIVYLASSAALDGVVTYWDQRLPTLGMDVLGKQALDNGGTLYLFEQGSLGGQITLHPGTPVLVDIAVCTTWVHDSGCRQGT